jgi:hypothetical protein
MAEELDSESWFELKPIEFRGRVWAVSEWAPILGFIVIVVNGMVFSILWGLIELALLLALIGHLQSRSEGPVYGSDSTEPLESGQVTESKLPSKAEAAEWAKQNSEYFLAWNKRKYAASKTWLGQKREDFAEWRHQRKLARYRIVAMPDQGVITAVDDVMEPSEDALEEDAMAKMLVDTDSEPAEAVPEEVEETQTIVIPAPPVFSSPQTPPRSTPRAPLVDYDRVPAYLRKATRIFYGVLLAFYALAMFNFAYDIGLFDFFYSDFVVERFMGEYPGTQIGVKPRAIILGTLFLCTSLLMLIGYRPFVTMFILASTLIFSIMLRLDYADPLSDGSAHIVKDIAWSSLFLIFCSITFFAREPDINHPLLGPQELISASTDKGSGEKLEIMKPRRPNRRARPLFFYEGVFLLLSMILWPLALFSLAALASADLRAEWGLPADFDSGALSGQIFQGILFGLAIVSTTAVYKFDREARDAPMYAKEMEAYVKHMEHWININNDFYEREHARLTAGLDASSDEE